MKLVEFLLNFISSSREMPILRAACKSLKAISGEVSFAESVEVGITQLAGRIEASLLPSQEDTFIISQLNRASVLFAYFDMSFRGGIRQAIHSLMDSPDFSSLGEKVCVYFLSVRP